jgi:AmiR/NasT family two-component response regulator
MYKKLKAIVAEDEVIIALDVAASLRKLGYNISSIVNAGEKLIEKHNTCEPDLILTDIMLKGEINGIEAAKIIKRKRDVPILFLAGFSDPQFYKDASLISPNGLIVKPFNTCELKSKIDILLGKSSEALPAI